MAAKRDPSQRPFVLAGTVTGIDCTLAEPVCCIVATLKADTPALAPEYGYYQRLVARDQSEAADLIERHITTEPPRSVYDALLLPALNYAERDRLEQRLSADEETGVIDATRELMSDTAAAIQHLQPAAPSEDPTPPGPRQPLRVLGYATNGVADEVALVMLAHLVDALPIAIEITRTRLQASELVGRLLAVSGRVGLSFGSIPPGRGASLERVDRVPMFTPRRSRRA